IRIHYLLFLKNADAWWLSTVWGEPGGGEYWDTDRRRDGSALPGLCRQPWAPIGKCFPSFSCCGWEVLPGQAEGGDNFKPGRLLGNEVKSPWHCVFLER
uniref:Uncharacterized protein n=1 Tax=Pavo cristatus TaxID=9049 RepID=A0A8C9F5W9_PAVCR